ncbi:MAG TPA: hypothetical protein VLF95_02770 [Vicinamibacteria bacterium]|nr:hypothetical protein [Vicinamibacteria bacterium]
MKRALAVAVLLWPWPSPGPAQEPFGLPLTGEAAETFLKTAEVVRKKALSLGITHSDQYTLSDGTRTCRAIWKTIDEFKRGVTSLEGGGVIVDFADSWKHEVAAYELDKLIGLGLVPPTVERRFGRTAGSLQMWVEGAMSEADRKEKHASPPDAKAWNEQMYKVRLLHQLTDNTDFRNIRNVLSDPSFRVYAVDCSRGFTIYGDLRAAKELVRFPRATLERLRGLDRPTLDAKLRPWLNGAQIEGILKRRDKILALAERRVTEQGEAAVLY